MLSNAVFNLILSDLASHGDFCKIKLQDECPKYGMNALELDDFLKCCEANGYIRAVRCLGGYVQI